MAAQHITVNRTHKDSVFRDLFGSEERKANTLSLYNALSGRSYDDPNLIEITTIDDALWLGVRNDISFLIDDEMVLWEHQSTTNPNMPLRGLVYFAHLYNAWITKSGRTVHTTELIELPTPRYFVFYNGKRDRPDRETLRLSHAFTQTGCIEVVVDVININEGHNNDLLQACEALAGYAHLIKLIRSYHETVDLASAVDAAVSQCVAEGVLVDYLNSRRAEVRDMFMLEFDEAEEKRRQENEMRIAKERATAEGLAEGRAEERSRTLEAVLGLIQSQILTPDEACERFGFTQEELEKARA